MSNKKKRPGKNSTWINDLNHEHQKELSKVVNKTQVVPLGPKRVTLQWIKDFKSNWQHVHPKVNNQREETWKKEEKRTELEYKNKTHSIVINKSTVVVQKGKRIKPN